MERIQDAIGEVQEEFIADAGYRVAKKPKRWVYWAAAAACLVLGIVIGAFAATTVMADEYSQAEVEAMLAQAEAESAGFITAEELSVEKSDALAAMEFLPYPVNENGQTYGLMVGFSDGSVLLPDLVEVPMQGYDEYTPGYLYAETYREYCEADIGESISMGIITDDDGNVVGWGLPAYASDGVTIVGMF